MPIGLKAYNQICTYWGAPVQDGYGGWTFSDPVLLKCRWEASTEKFMNQQGQEQVSRAIVWTYDELDVGGYLIEGDATATEDPTALDDALVIARVDEIPDLRGLNKEVRSFL